jgi:hypothetical protein
VKSLAELHASIVRRTTSGRRTSLILFFRW